VSEENVQIVRAAYETAQREQTLESFLELLDPEIVWDNRAVWPDGSRYHGLDEVRREGRRWLGTWEEYRFTAEEFLDAGDWVLVALHVQGRGKGSGVEVDQHFVEAWRMRDGKAIEHCAYRTREEALKAAGG
jgi:ketosteroid isomerase-like protein